MHPRARVLPLMQFVVYFKRCVCSLCVGGVPFICFTYETKPRMCHCFYFFPFLHIHTKDMLLEASYTLVAMSELEHPSFPHSMMDGYESCLLHHVASKDGARILVDLLPCEDLVRHEQREGFTPLHHASSQVAEFLLKRGADANVKTRSGLTPLFVADTAAAAHVLLKHGGNPSATNTYLHNPLHLATSHGLWDVVWLLIRAGGDVTQRGVDGTTPLDLCCTLLKHLPNDTSKNIKALAKVKRMLEIWDECGELEEVKNASSNGSAHSFHQKRFAMFEQRCSNAAQASISKNPALSLSNATNLPIELTSMILVQYVGIFIDANGLKDDAAVFVPRNRMRYRNNTPVVLNPRFSITSFFKHVLLKKPLIRFLAVAVAAIFVFFY
jgi:hypothetical protein